MVIYLLTNNKIRIGKLNNMEKIMHKKGRAKWSRVTFSLGRFTCLLGREIIVQAGCVCVRKDIEGV